MTARSHFSRFPALSFRSQVLSDSVKLTFGTRSYVEFICIVLLACCLCVWWPSLEVFVLSLSVPRPVADSLVPILFEPAKLSLAHTLAGMLFLLLATAFIASMQSFDSVELWTDLGIHVVFFLLHCSTVLYVCLLQRCPIFCHSTLCACMAHYQAVQPWIDCPKLFLFSSLLYPRSFGRASCIAASASSLSSILLFMEIALLHSISVSSI